MVFLLATARKMCTRIVFFLCFEIHHKECNRIDREEVRAQLQKFQHAKVDRPTVLPYVTHFAAGATSKERGKKIYTYIYIRVTFSFRAETKAAFPLSFSTNRLKAPSEPRQGKLPSFSMRNTETVIPVFFFPATRGASLMIH